MRESLTITSVPMIVDLALPLIMQISLRLPVIDINFSANADVVDLSDGTTIALRGGKPNDPSLVSYPLGTLEVGLMASRSYLKWRGRPGEASDLAAHDFTGSSSSIRCAPWFRWLSTQVAEPRIVFLSDSEGAQKNAIRSGRCAGFLPLASLLWMPELEPLFPPQPEFRGELWLAHHVRAKQHCWQFGEMLAEQVKASMSH